MSTLFLHIELLWAISLQLTNSILNQEFSKHLGLVFLMADLDKVTDEFFERILRRFPLIGLNEGQKLVERVF